jgi:hypothetical protein
MDARCYPARTCLDSNRQLPRWSEWSANRCMSTLTVLRSLSCQAPSGGMHFVLRAVRSLNLLYGLQPS